MSKSWYLTTSDTYLSGFENEEFTLNAPTAFDEILLNSPESYLIEINGGQTIAIVQDKDAREVKNLLTRLDTVSRGDQITYKNHIYLVMDFVDDNKMHQTSEIKLCNSNITIKSIPLSPPIIGYDDFMNPIYPDDYDPTPQEIPFPAIVEKTVVNEDTGAKIALDEDIYLTIQCTVC